jgi:hypothetical protein
MKSAKVTMWTVVPIYSVITFASWKARVRCLWADVSNDGTSYSDRFTVPLSLEQRELLSKASSVSLRDPVQLYASAFYRSPTFALERWLIWRTGSELLYRSDWEVGTNVGKMFTVSCFGVIVDFFVV